MQALGRAGLVRLADLARLEPEALAARLGPIGRLIPAAAWIAVARAETAAPDAAAAPPRRAEATTAAVAPAIRVVFRLIGEAASGGHVRLVHGDRLLDVLEVAGLAALEHQPARCSSCGSSSAECEVMSSPASASRVLKAASDLLRKAVSPTAVISSTRYQSKATPIDMPKASRARIPEE